MKKLFTALLLSPLAAPLVAPIGVALAQDEPAARFSRKAVMPPLSSRAMPAAPTVHRLSIGPLSHQSMTLSEEALTAPVDAAETNATEALVERANRGDPQANYRLGLNYIAGEGVTRNLVEAFARIRLAAEAGHPRAVSLFYSLGAKLTAEEHGRAFDRSQKLRPPKEKELAR